MEEEICKENNGKTFIALIKDIKNEGIDVSDIKLNDTIADLAERSGMTSEELEKTILYPKEKIGKVLYRVRRIYNGKVEGRSLSEEQIKEIQELGISLEMPSRKIKNIQNEQKIKMVNRGEVEDFLIKIENLERLGVDVSEIRYRDNAYTLLERYNIPNSKWEELGFKCSNQIGAQLTLMRRIYKGNVPEKEITQEQLERFKKYNIILDEEEMDTRYRFIQTIKKMKDIGIDVTSIREDDTISRVARRCGIDSDEILKVGLNIHKQIGPWMYSIINAYKGKNKLLRPTPSQVDELKELGIDLDALIKTKSDTHQIKKDEAKMLKEKKITKKKEAEMLKEKSKKDTENITKDQLWKIICNTPEEKCYQKKILINQLREKKSKKGEILKW